MKNKRHKPEEIIKKLREAATVLAAGQSVEEACRKLEVSRRRITAGRSNTAGRKRRQ
jgi:hypothetical protein